MALTPVKTWIAPGADLAADPSSWPWVDVSTQVRQASPITIQAGRADEWESIDAGSCTLTFDDTSGDFSELNPSGQWHGLLGPDTPIRVAVRRGEDDFDRTVSNGWGTADSGQAWATTSGAASDYAVAGGAATHTIAAANAARYTTLDVALRQVDVTASFSTSFAMTGAAGTVTLIGRWTDINNAIMGRATLNTTGTVDLLIQSVVGGVATSLATATAIAGVTHGAGVVLHGRFRVWDNTASLMVWEDGDDPPGWQATTDAVPILTAGRVGVRSVRPTGNTNTGFAVSYSAFATDVDRFGGYAAGWAPRTTHRDASRTVPVTAHGEIGRTVPRQGTLPVLSPLRRAIAADPATVAYWPAEEGPAAGQIASAIPGHAPATIFGTMSFTPIEEVVTGAGETIRYGTPSLANFEAGARLDIPVPAAVTAAIASAFSLYCLAQITQAAASSNIVLMEWDTPGGTFGTWQLIQSVSPANVVLRAWTSYPGGSATDVVTVGSLGTGLLNHAVGLAQNGGNIDAGVRLDGFGGYLNTGSVAGTLAGPTAIRINSILTTYSDDLFPIGHFAVRAGYASQGDGFDGTNDDGYGGIVQGARLSYQNQAAHLRLARLLAEDGIRFTMPTVDDADQVQRMFGQDEGTRPELWHACELVDGGVLREAPFSLSYLPRAYLYAQAPLTLGYSEHLGEPPAPALTTAVYRNQVTLKRTLGSQLTVRTAGVDAGRELPRDDTVDVELATDDQLPQQAAWRLNRRALRVPTWSGLQLKMAALPASLVDAWLSADVGTRVVLDGVATAAGAADVEGVLQGWTERLGNALPTWTAEIDLSPGEIWNLIGTWDGTARYDSGSSTLTSGITSTATSVSVTTSDPFDLWRSGAVTFMINVGGEIMNVTNVSGTTSPQTFTVSRSANGVVKSHDAGAEVHVWPISRYGL